MKNKFVFILFLILSLILVTAPFVVTAEEGLVNCGQTTIVNGNPTVTNLCDFQKFMDLVVKIYNYLLMIIIPIATVSIAYAGALYMIYSTNDSKRKQAHDIITSAVWGLALALAGYLIITSVLKLLVPEKIGSDNNPTRDILNQIPIQQ